MPEKEPTNWLPYLLAGAAALGSFATWVGSWVGLKRDVQALGRRADSNDEKHKRLDDKLSEISDSLSHIEGALGIERR